MESAFLKRTVRFLLLSALFMANSPAFSLEVFKTEQGLPFISHQGNPVFGFGPSPQNILTFLPSGQGNDYVDWVDWATKHQMNFVRSYPPSFIVESPAINVFKSAPGKPDKVDLNKLNDEYFDLLQKACELFNEKGMYVHLQLWQAVTWKKNWQENYYNPKNNINPDLSRNAGPGEFMSVQNLALLEHQKEYVRKILDSVAHLGNVYFDIANEIGNGTDSSLSWVLEMMTTIREWEKKNDHRLLVTINDEGGVRVDGIEQVFSQSDLIIKDLGRWDEHMKAQKEYAKPTVSVRNIDWNFKTEKRRYFFDQDDLEVNTNPNLQTRGRKYWWRMYMARVQMAGAYADAYDKVERLPGINFLDRILAKLGAQFLVPEYMAPSYRLNKLSERNFIHFRNFISKIESYTSLIPSNGNINGHSAPHIYCLQSDEQAIFYLESPNGEAGFRYSDTPVILNELRLSDGKYSGYFYYPESGKERNFVVTIKNGKGDLIIPAFTDDLAIFVNQVVGARSY